MIKAKHTSWLVYGLVALALGLVVNVILGPLFTDTIEYHFGESLTNQGIAVDAVALFAVVPIAIAAAILVGRGHRAGPVLTLIPAAFTAYMAPQYVVGPDYLGIPGNNEQFFLLHLGLFIVAVALFVTAWSAIDRVLLVPDSRVSDLRRSWVMLGVAAFIMLGRWLPGVIDLTSGRPSTVEYLDNPTAYLLIGILDLGLVVPAAVTAAMGLRRGAAWARAAAYGVIGWFTLVPASVAAMSIVMLVNDDPIATLSSTVMLTSVALIFTAGAILLYRPLFVEHRRLGPIPDSPAHIEALRAHASSVAKR